MVPTAWRWRRDWGTEWSGPGCAVGVAPFGLDDLDFFAGMDPLNVIEFSWALDGEQRLAPELIRELAEMGERVADDPSKFLGRRLGALTRPIVR